VEECKETKEMVKYHSEEKELEQGNLSKSTKILQHSPPQCMLVEENNGSLDPDYKVAEGKPCVLHMVEDSPKFNALQSAETQTSLSKSSESTVLQPEDLELGEPLPGSLTVVGNDLSSPHISVNDAANVSKDDKLEDEKVSRPSNEQETSIVIKVPKMWIDVQYWAYCMGMLIMALLLVGKLQGASYSALWIIFPIFFGVSRVFK
jgi:hypothetical protein